MFYHKWPSKELSGKSVRYGFDLYYDENGEIINFFANDGKRVNKELLNKWKSIMFLETQYLGKLPKIFMDTDKIGYNESDSMIKLDKLKRLFKKIVIGIKE